MLQPVIQHEVSSRRRYSSEEANKARQASQDNQPTIFSKIIDKTIPAKIVHEDDKVISWCLLFIQLLYIKSNIYITCIAGSLCYCLTGNKSEEEIYHVIVLARIY